MTPNAIDGVLLPPPWEEQDPLLPYPGYYPENPGEWLIERHRSHLQRARDERDAIRAVFLGDSITQGWALKQWDEHFASYGAVNFGIGGDKSCQVLWRIGDGLLEGLTPKVVVLAIGVNSIWSGAFTPERIGDGVLRCVDAIRAACPGAKVLVSAVLPCMESADHPYRAVICAINAHVSPVADGESIFFVDAGTALVESDDSLPRSVAPDGVHLSVEGYRRYATVLAPEFRRILAAT